MSYEKLGFTSGQTLKADHLNHMEEGIANAGGAGFEYWQGEVTFNQADNFFKLHGLDTFIAERNACEVEIAIKSNSSSDTPSLHKFSFVMPDSGSLFFFESEYADYMYSPRARMTLGNGYMALYIDAGFGSSAVPVFNPEIRFVRVYHGV